MKNEILEIIMRNHISDDNHNKTKINELKSVLGKKYIQEKEHKITKDSAQAFTKKNVIKRRKEEGKRRE